MDEHVENGQEREGVALLPICLDGCADERLRQDELGEIVKVEEMRVILEELDEKAFYGVEVDGGVWVEEFKVDIYKALWCGRRVSCCKEKDRFWGRPHDVVAVATSISI